MAWPPTTHQDAADEITSLRDGKGWASTLGGRQRIGEALRSAPLLWVVGRYFSAQITGGSTTVAPPASELRLVPLYVHVPRTIDRVACNVTTACTGGHVARFGIYNADATSGLPTTVLVDAGSVPVDTVSSKEVVVSGTLHGLYWLGLTAQSGTFSALSVTTTVHIGGAQSSGATPGNGVSYPSVDPTLALPDRTGVVPSFSAITTPVVTVRAA